MPIKDPCCAAVGTAIFLVALLNLASGQVSSQAAPADAVRAALAVFGGEARVRSVPAIVAVGRGTEYRSAEMQGLDVDDPTPSKHEEVVATAGADRLVYEHHTERHDGTTRWRRWIHDGATTTVLDIGTMWASRRENPAADRARRGYARVLPPLLLLEAVANAEKLTAAGAERHEGREHSIVAFEVEGAPVRMWFDVERATLSKVEYDLDYPLLGPTTVEVAFKPYARHATLGSFPAGYAIRVAGRLYRDVTWTSVRTEAAAADP